nr:MAG TPA: hypothetical protein [Caudoviricetes sp.]
MKINLQLLRRLKTFVFALLDFMGRRDVNHSVSAPS